MTSLRDILAARRNSAAVHSLVHKPVGKEGTLRREEGRGTSTERNGSADEIENSLSGSFLSRGVVESGEGSRGEAREAGSLDLAANWIAEDIARALEDPGSLRFFRKVALTVPLRVLSQALALALELRPDEVRRSRAAYFTALVRPHLLGRRRS
jgi:hypothetical protein